MARISFLDCKHTQVQQFTDYCLLCGHNIYKTNEQYLTELRQEFEKKDAVIRQIREFEKKLGIGCDDPSTTKT